MKKIVLTAILGIIAFSSYSQSNSFYKVGDTLYYSNNRATYLKTKTFVIIKEVNVNEKKNNFNVEKFVADSINGTYFLDSKFTSIGLHQLKSNGIFTSFHKNGKVAFKGETINGKRSKEIWTYWYENGTKKSEEKTSNGTYFSDETQNLIINFWDKKGEQTVTDGQGLVNYLNDEGLLIKGSYKDGLKNGLWTAFSGEQKKYEEKYKKGKLSKGTSWNDDEVLEYKEVSSSAYYKDKDNSAVRNYVAKKFNPDSAGIIGDVFVTFIVTKDGELNKVNVIRGLNAEYNKEVIKVLSEMKGWTPAQIRGKTFDSKYSLNLRFSE